MKDILTILILISFLGCKDTETDTQEVYREYAELIISERQDKLSMISTDKQLRFDSPCAFMNAEGDTVIPFGKYHVWDSVNFYTYAIVKTPESIVGINRKGEIMFDAYLWGDAQLDDINEGLFRIKRNGKIGYANENGEIVIPCQFECAEQFKNGQAKVTLECEYRYDEIDHVEMESDNWFYIDKKGNKITTPQQRI